jgi:hypothetical protein
MPGSIIAKNSAGAALKAKEVTLPVYADDLADNVCAGFDNTRVYIKDCTDALEESLNSKLEAITSRIDALTDNLINPLAREDPHHAAPLWDVPPQQDGHVDVLARRPISPVHGGVAADFEDDVGYAPRQPHFDARRAAPVCVFPVDRGRVDHAARVSLDDGIGCVKISIPPFSGAGSPEDYLEWEMRVNHIFAAHHYTEEKKIQLAVIEFSGYVLIWWSQILRMPNRPTSWRGMKELMHRRFVPEHYKREMYHKLQRLTQANMSVDAYYKEMELLMICTGTTEDPEATMSRFFNGLNVEVVVYYNIEDLVH